MRRRGLIWLLLIAGLTAVFASTLLAGPSKTCTDVVNTTPDGTYTRYCGPARAHVVLDGKPYDVRGGTCEVTTDRKTREFNVGIGWATTPWPGKPWKGHLLGVGIFRFTGNGNYPIASNRAAVSVVITPRNWRSYSQKLGAPKAWGVGRVSITAGGTRGTFSVLVEAPPGGPHDSLPPYSEWLSVPATGSFSCR